MMISVFRRMKVSSRWSPSRTSSRLVQEAAAQKEVQVPSLKAIPSIWDVPGPSPSLPFIGTGWQYFRWGRYNLYRLHDANLDKYIRYGPIVREEYQWRRPVIHLFQPEDFEVVFRHQGKYPLRPASEFLRHYRLNRPEKYDSAGLVNSEGEEWYRLRSALTPVLMKMKSIAGMIADQNNICNDFISFVRELRSPSTKEIENLQDAIYKLALESICMVCMDFRLGCMDTKLAPGSDAEIMIEASQKTFDAYQKLFYGLPLWKYVRTDAYRKLDEAESAIYRAASKHIERTIKKLRAAKIEDKDHYSVLETLVQTEGLSEKEIRMTVIDFIIGGIFTVTNTLSFLLFNIARNPEVQKKLHREVQTVAPDGEITKERINNFQYLKACVKENFRLTPTVPCLARILPEDIVLRGYHIPAGTPIFCHFKVTSQLSENFHSPESFQPERWLNERERIHPFCIVPFGFGSRMCVGRRFSEMEMYISVAKIIKNFWLESTHDKLDVIQAFITIPSHPVSVQFRDR